MACTKFLLLFTTIVFSRINAVEVDEAVLEEGAKGTAVVLLSIAHIQQAAIFPDDNEMLRRIAYVETRDGSDPDTCIQRRQQRRSLGGERSSIGEH